MNDDELQNVTNLRHEIEELKRENDRLAEILGLSGSRAGSWAGSRRVSDVNDLMHRRPPDVGQRQSSSRFAKQMNRCEVLAAALEAPGRY